MATSTAVVTVTVDSMLLAVDDNARTVNRNPVSVPVLANDILNGVTGILPSELNAPITITTPSNGSAVVNVDGTVTYTPNPGFAGVDTFEYTISVSDEEPDPLTMRIVALGLRIESPITLEIQADAGQMIDWGDGTSAVHPGGTLSHVYTDANSPENITVTQPSGGTPSSINRVIFTQEGGSFSDQVDVLSWGNNTYPSSSAVFAIPNLRRVPSNKPPYQTTLAGMFENDGYLQSDLSTWDVSEVTDFSNMFANGDSDPDIGSWKVAAAVNMEGMFNGNSSFNRDLSGWCVSNIPEAPTLFDEGASSWTLPRPVWGTCP